MNKNRLQKEIATGEDSTRQFKVDIKNADSLAAEMVAFSNTDGGTIYIGVEDNGNIKGLSPQDVRRINQLISNTATQHVRSPLSPITENIEVTKRKMVIALTVPEGVDKPYFDRNGIIWFKNGADKRKVHSKDELRRIFQESGSVRADETRTEATIENIDKERFRDFFSKFYNSKLPRSKADLIRLFENLELAKKGSLNLAGVLLFGENPQRFKPLSVTKAVAFPGTSIAASEYLDSEDFEGTLQQQYEGAVSFVMRNLRKEQRGQNFNSLGIPEIPRFVFEELIVNALIHRDYLVNSTIRVLVFTDRIEIISPGSLPDNLTVESIKLGVSVPRNPIIISLISKGLLPYRGLGSGIRRVLDSKVKIDFDSNPDTLSFTVTVWRKSDLVNKAESKGRVKAESGQSQTAESETPIEDRIIAILQEKPLGKADIARSLGKAKPDGQVNSSIRELLKNGKIERTIPEKPNSRHQKYRLNIN